MTTLAVPRSRRTSATAVYHAPVSNVLYDCHPGGKIQGCSSAWPLFLGAARNSSHDVQFYQIRSPRLPDASAG